jgi:glycosyltransferase involved in cell wall biosynthesis
MTGGAGSVGQSAARREPLRILMVAARYFPFVGGTETHVHEVGTRLATMGHAVAILTSDPTGRHPAREDAAGMQIVRVKAWPERSDLHFSPGICADILKGRWEIIHIQGYHTCVAPLGMIGALCRSIPFVITFHSGGHSSGFRRRLRRVQHLLLRPLVARAARLIAVSNFEADYFSRQMRLDRKRFSVVPNGAQLPVADAHAGKSESSCLIVSVGRLERYKGHHRVIAALPHLLERIPQAHVRVAGEGPYEVNCERSRAGTASPTGSRSAASRRAIARAWPLYSPAPRFLFSSASTKLIRSQSWKACRSAARRW